MKETWTFGSLMALKCPLCGHDTFKAGFYRSAKKCSHCGLDFEPETGFYAGSIYPMYGMSALIGGSVSMAVFLSGGSVAWMFTAAIAALLVASPWIFWYARLGFLHTNHRFFEEKA